VDPSVGGVDPEDIQNNIQALLQLGSDVLNSLVESLQYCPKYVESMQENSEVLISLC
jgi:uncharacterized NAD-dependent epimerase/dehydratase family protein